MHLVKKYTGTAMDRLLLDLMVQGVFEGANTPDFRDAVVLHRITKVPLPDSNWVRVNCPSEFRYLRYRGPKGSNSCIAEAMFFDADGKLIRGPVSVHLRRRTERPGIVQKFMMGANIPILPLRMPIPPGPVCSWRYLSASAGSVTFPGTTIILSNRATYTNCWCGTGDNGTRWDGRCPTPMDSIMREFLPDTSTG
ncbi:hypothetical protein B5F93_17765 [Odoribacter splanchnicus]|nr:hypothetical protein B5F93_17765 [Odoribacter splanchnicus]HAC96129.1 hypothetical protein [Odoribacter splanchnicus]